MRGILREMHHQEHCSSRRVVLIYVANQSQLHQHAGVVRLKCALIPADFVNPLQTLLSSLGHAEGRRVDRKNVTTKYFLDIFLEVTSYQKIG